MSRSIGLNKGRGKFLFLQKLNFKKQNAFIFCAVNVKLALLDYVIIVYFVTILLLLIGERSRPLLPIG
jgi:hypothetical protein